MKAKELMLGDWVYVNGNYPHRVYSLDKDAQRIDIFSQECDIQPIPISAEILEKNGFEKSYNEVQKREQWLHADDYYDILIYEYSDGMYRVVVISCEISNYEEICYVSYMHQLQQFLRLCGIDKNIEL